MDDLVTASALWERLAALTQDDLDDWLEAHELLVDGEWRSFVLADIERHPGTPLVLYTHWPAGERRVPMNSMISVRERRG